jgi:hypothetical protein
LSPARSSVEGLALNKLPKKLVDFDTETGKAKTLNELRNILDSEIELLWKRNHMLKPPFEPQVIRKVGGAKINYDYLPRSQVGADGSLEATSQGFLIKIDENLVEKSNQFRLRSTLAHELMHIFFYDGNVLPPKKFGNDASRESFLMEEGMCYYLTREFLMPKFSIRQLLSIDKSKSTPSVENLDFLKSGYVVSSDIVAYRMIIDLGIWDCLFIKFIQEGDIFRSKTQLKSKRNRFYGRMKIPRYLPSQKTTCEWLEKLYNHLICTKRNQRFQELVRLENHLIALESEVEASHPFSIATISYEENTTY